VDRAEALQALPDTYAIALRLRDEGMEPEAVARVFGIERQAVGPLLTLAEGSSQGSWKPSKGQLFANAQKRDISSKQGGE